MGEKERETKVEGRERGQVSEADANATTEQVREERG